MTHETREERLARVRAALARYDVIEAARQLNEGGPVAPGRIYYVRGLPENVYLVFAVVSAHPDNTGDVLRPADDDVFFVVPCDDNTTVLGLMDVASWKECNRYYFGDLVARCGQGFWTTRAFFERTRYMGQLEVDHEKRIRKVLASAARGTLHGGQRHDEANPDYEEWMLEVGTAVHRLRGED